MKSSSLFYVSALALSVLLVPSRTFAAEPTPAPADDIAAVAPQQNVPAKAEDAEDKVERAVRRFGVGVSGGVGLDPEIIDVGVHGTFGPIFHRGVTFRPGIELGFGEVTTMFAVNLDFLYTLPGATRTTRWTPYVGAGPNFGLSHRGVSSADLSPDTTDRFNFGDTTFDAGLNFIAGARNRSGMFVEMKATAYGVSNVRLLAGFNF